MELLKKIEDLLDEKKVEDITILDVKDRTPFSEYYVIGTALNERSLEAIAQALEDLLFREKGIDIKKDGTPESGWIAIEADNVLVHVLTKEKREIFKLEDIK